MTLKFNNRLSITPVEEGGGGGGSTYTTMTIPFSSAMYRSSGSYGRVIYWWVEDVCWCFGNYVGTINVFYPDQTMRGLYPFMVVRGVDTVTEELQPESVMHFKITDGNDVELVPFTPILYCILDTETFGATCFKNIFGDYVLYWLIETVNSVPTITLKDVTYQGTSVTGAKLVHEIRIYTE